MCEEVCPDVGASECVETIGANESTKNVESLILTTYVTVALRNQKVLLHSKPPFQHIKIEILLKLL